MVNSTVITELHAALSESVSKQLEFYRQKERGDKTVDREQFVMMMDHF